MIIVFQNPIERPETPPTGSIPLPSERMPLSVAQKTIVDALEDEGNVGWYSSMVCYFMSISRCVCLLCPPRPGVNTLNQ